jgi:outer membrane protein OmpA-like peptidoglycan-associated protein
MRSLSKPAGSLACVLLLSRAALAADVGFAVNAEGAASHLVGENKSGQFGWGATGLVSPELKIGRRIGVELPLGVVGLTESSNQDPAFARSSAGTAFLAMPGVRLRPFATKPGGWGEAFWVAGGGGIAQTGGLTRPSVDMRAGVDVHLAGVGVGPFGGMIQIIEPSSGVRSEDARLALVGVHASFEPIKTREGDRDADGIPDSVDACPDQPEDMDGFQDKDGCPDPDNDGDGIADATDHCPNDAEDMDGFQDKDGCPDPDNDRDGIPDAADRCATEPEDMDGFQDKDGCPDPDNDQDGIPDATDKCPNDRETKNGFEDADGCPDEEHVRLLGDHLVLDDRVHFPVNQSVILFKSYPLLTNVAKLINDHPAYERIQISGHADDTGEHEYNWRLSEARARAVMALLVKFGVKEDRLFVEFYGQQRPRVQGQTWDARRQNRRVEFEIVQRRQLPQSRMDLPPPLAPRVERAAMRAPVMMKGGAR